MRLTSLPARERELKLSDRNKSESDQPSLPARERELKQRFIVENRGFSWSLPARERELKLKVIMLHMIRLLVAPRTGA